MSHDVVSHSMSYDLVVIGGGPAGVAGALTAALGGLRVALLDASARLGGQYFRHQAGDDSGPQGFDRFLRQCRALGDRAEVLLKHQVWSVTRDQDAHLDQDGNLDRDGHLDRDARLDRDGHLDRDGRLIVHAVTADRRPVTLRARHVLIATGAYDRPLPFTGWDLPGVLTAGGAQALLKGNGVVAGRRIVVSGTGPFLLPVAAGLAGAGAEVIGVFEANGGLGLARHPVLALGKAGEALGYGLRLAGARVPYLTRQAVVAAHGRDELESVTVARLDRNWNVLATRRVACDTLAVGYGFVPQIDLGTQLGCRTRADVDGSPVLAVDALQRTDVPGVWAAGEPTGVGGWRLAALEGRIAGLAIARSHAVTATSRAVTATSRAVTATSRAVTGGRTPERPGDAGVPEALVRRRERMRAFGAALQRAYPVAPGWRTWLRDDTLVCRCEEVPLAAIRQAQDLGATDARSVKSLARPGMGWCQGRMCGYAVSCLVGEPQRPPRRPIAQPVTLGALAETVEDPAP
ncbi:FAD-dependent oxidoreductase [Nonomuraea sp. NN258]|nr:FAD-dependent oxidoreductase [Nonomuraea antri]